MLRRSGDRERDPKSDVKPDLEASEPSGGCPVPGAGPRPCPSTSTTDEDADASEELNAMTVYSAPSCAFAQNPAEPTPVTTCPSAMLVAATVPHAVSGTSNSAE